MENGGPSDVEHLQQSDFRLPYIKGGKAKFKLLFVGGETLSEMLCGADKIPDTDKYYSSAQAVAREHMLDSVDSNVKTIHEALDEFQQEGPRAQLPYLFPVDTDTGKVPCITSGFFRFTIIICC